MNRINQQLGICSRALFVFLATAVFSCDEHPVDPDAQPLWGDYYPTIEGSTWTYVNTTYCELPDETVCLEEREIWAGGDPPFFNDSRYKPISASYGTIMWVRKERGEYFIQSYYQPEYKFLDTTVGLNGQWSYGNEYIKQVFTMVEMNATKVVNGVRFTNVIGIKEVTLQRNAPDEWQEASVLYHYYAKGVGEIYKFRPDGMGEGRDWEIYLKEYSIKP